MRDYFLSNFLVRVPAFTNPFDFLIKVSVCPENIPVKQPALVQMARELMHKEQEQLESIDFT